MTARAYELMPFLLTLLQSEQQLSRSTILERVQPFLASRNYESRDPAVDFGLKYLTNEGYLHKPQHGTYAITVLGSQAKLSEEGARNIEARYESPNR